MPAHIRLGVCVERSPLGSAGLPAHAALVVRATGDLVAHLARLF
jgi:hypothetical protein